jgi:hypothetical protein
MTRRSEHGIGRARVEQPVGCEAANQDRGVLPRVRWAICAVARESHVDVRHREDSGAHLRCVAVQALVVAAAISFLVMG